MRRQMAALLAPSASPGQGGGTGPGRHAGASASGVPGEGLATLATVEAGDLALGFRGQVVAGESGNTASGSLDLRAADAARIAALVGLSPPLRLDGLPIAGSLKFSVDRSSTRHRRMALSSPAAT